jgi:hypothetical protein
MLVFLPPTHFYVPMALSLPTLVSPKVFSSILGGSTLSVHIADFCIFSTFVQLIRGLCPPNPCMYIFYFPSPPYSLTSVPCNPHLPPLLPLPLYHLLYHPHPIPISPSPTSHSPLPISPLLPTSIDIPLLSPSCKKFNFFLLAFPYHIFMCIAIANFSFHWLLIFSVITCAWIFVIPFLAAHFLSSYMFLIFQFFLTTQLLFL